MNTSIWLLCELYCATRGELKCSHVISRTRQSPADMLSAIRDVADDQRHLIASMLFVRKKHIRRASV